MKTNKDIIKDVLLTCDYDHGMSWEEVCEESLKQKTLQVVTELRDILNENTFKIKNKLIELIYKLEDTI